MICQQINHILLLLVLFIVWRNGVWCFLSSRVVFVQEFDNSLLDPFFYLRYSHRNVYNYTLNHGYDYQLIEVGDYDTEVQLSLSRSWKKVFAILDLLRSGRYDYVVYIDNKLFINTPQIPFIQMLKKWNPFADSYMIRNLDVIVVGERNVEDPIMAYNIDLTWDGSFQIWKNTPDNHHFIRQWMGITRSIFYTSIWTKNYPYEMGAFQNVFLRDWLTHYHCIIEMREGQDAYGFLSIDSSLTVNQSLSLMNVDLMEESLFLDLSDVYKEYQRIPEAWILTNYERYDPNNNIIIVSTMYVDHAYSILYSDFHNQKPVIDSYCLSNELNTIECNHLIQSYQQYNYNKIYEMREYHYQLFYNKFLQTNPTFFQDGQPGLLPDKYQIKSLYPRVIITVFAGRKDRLLILMKYLQLALSYNIIQEVHLWDYCRNDDDRQALLSFIDPEKNIYHRTPFIATGQKRYWIDYYYYYDQHRLYYPKDIIIKCDDDTVFMDIVKLPYFISLLKDEEETINGVLFANIINNGVASYYQQHLWNIFPREEFGELEYPENGYCGTLWSSGERANKVHNYFLDHFNEIIQPTEEFYYQPEIIPITTRFSINFFAIQVKNWFKIKDIGIDDEFDLTITLPELQIMTNHLSSNFFVSHLSFGGQQKESFDTERLLSRYEVLYEKYVDNHKDFFNAISSRNLIP